MAKCEAVALIHLGKYAACLAALEAKQRPVAEALVFEKAYALYQLNRLADALKVNSSYSADSFGRSMAVGVAPT